MTMNPILVVDDEPDVRSMLCETIQQFGFPVESVSNGREALEKCCRSSISLVISDVKMPEMGGLELLDQVKARSPSLPVILMTGFGSVNNAVEAIQKGAADYLLKPFSKQNLERAIQKSRLRDGNRFTDSPGGAPASSDQPHRDIITEDPHFLKSLQIARNVAASRSTVLIQGESGTGKELLARWIHQNSGFPDEPYVAVNCAALPDALAESELFGHEKGAFTGAVHQRAGKFELAGRGTLVLDEISEMALPLQAKLLRVLQEKLVDRIGGSRPIKVQARIVAISNVDLKSAVSGGNFRQDLYYRIHVVPLRVPPLRERKGDIALLATHFLNKYRHSGQFGAAVLSDAALARLCDYHWPGNVRELENAIERALLICGGKTIGPDDVMSDADIDPGCGADADPAAIQAGMTVKDMEKQLIVKTLQAVNDNRTHAAEMLGISIRTLRNKLREYKAD